MLVFEKINDLKKYLSDQRKTGSTIGFVPTMGALHLGHISLIERSASENDITVCSIFVNPTQFNDKNDLDKYPRTLDADKLILEKANCEVLFVPGVKEIYPEGTGEKGQGTGDRGQGARGAVDLKIAGSAISVKTSNLELRTSNYFNVDLGELDKVMEGASRPGHFLGVMQVVSRLFDIVDPDKAYFGQKDFQQQAIIREMTRQMNYGIDIVTCPILREEDGLAMSSRNVRLTPSERAVVGVISQTLFTVQKLADKLSVDELTMFVESEMAEAALTQLEYFQIVDAQSLQPVVNLDKAQNAVACIAVKLGKVRLIDNVLLK